MDASNIIAREVKLAEGTQHHILADIDVPDVWPEAIRWRNCQDLDLEKLMEVVLSILERSDPQRLSLPCLLQYVCTEPATKVCQFIDDLVSHVTGTPHQVSCPTLRFNPSSFMHWADTKCINDHIRKVSSEMSWPTLNLSRSYLQRQGASWCVAARLFVEFEAKTGFGTSLTATGLERYQARLLRHHESAFDSPIPYSTPESDPAPMPIYATNAYVRSDYHKDLLIGLGYAVMLPAGRKTKSKGKAVEKSKEVVKVVNAEGETVENMEVDVPEPRGVKRSSEGNSVPVASGSGRGRGRRPGWEPKMHQTIPVLKGTMCDMLHQIQYLKENLIESNRERDLELKRRRERDADYYRQKRQLRNVDVRYGEYQRAIARMSEENHHDMEAWKDLRADWNRERDELLADLKSERRRNDMMEGKLAVYESRSEKKKSKAAERGQE